MAATAETLNVLQRRPNEFLFSLLSLIACMVVVHAIYTLHVRPRAAAVMPAQRAAALQDPTYVGERSIYVIVKDWEQESEIILMLWAIALISHRALQQRNERRLLEADLMRIPDAVRILPEDTREYSRRLESLPPEERGRLVPRALIAALARFGATRNVQDVSTVVHGVCESEADRLDSELALLRYIAWAIPAIGFIGTVRGIGDALSQAHKAVTGDISGVTEGLGVAFNSTLVALLLSILLMFLLQHLQRVQERLVMDTETYVDQRLIRNMQTP